MDRLSDEKLTHIKQFAETGLMSANRKDTLALVEEVIASRKALREAGNQIKEAFFEGWRAAPKEFNEKPDLYYYESEASEASARLRAM